ncbi:MAG: hypothetical protein WCH44_16040 [Betaproteobacteria bacterium]
MKGAFGLVGLLISLGIVGVLVKKQLASTHDIVASLQQPGAHQPEGAASTPAATVRERSQQMQQQYKQAVEAAMQQPRAESDQE